MIKFCNNVTTCNCDLDVEQISNREAVRQTIQVSSKTETKNTQEQWKHEKYYKV